jgi:hypothetical protein
MKVDTTMDDHTAHSLAGKYGVKGPLPKTLSRDEKMTAYEARYIAAGGRKAEKYQRRSRNADIVRNIGAGVATGAAAGLLAGKSKKVAPILARAKVTPSRLETAGLAGATTAGTAELYGEHARHKRASYAHSPGGVAASALTRMRSYTPE